MPILLIFITSTQKNYYISDFMFSTQEVSWSLWNTLMKIDVIHHLITRITPEKRLLNVIWQMITYFFAGGGVGWTGVVSPESLIWCLTCEKMCFLRWSLLAKACPQTQQTFLFSSVTWNKKLTNEHGEYWPPIFGLKNVVYQRKAQHSVDEEYYIFVN